MGSNIHQRGAHVRSGQIATTKFPDRPMVLTTMEPPPWNSRGQYDSDLFVGIGPGNVVTIICFATPPLGISHSPRLRGCEPEHQGEAAPPDAFHLQRRDFRL